MAPDLKKIRQQLEEAAAKRERERMQGAFTEQLIRTVSEHLGSIFAPVLQEMRKNAELNLNELKEVLKTNLKGANPEISTRELSAAIEAAFKKITPSKIEVKAPDVHVAAPVVNTPGINMPDVFKAMLDYTNNKPLPVMMFDQKGQPFQFSLGASGGKGDFFTIQGFGASAFAGLQNPDGRLKVELPSGSSGLTDTELRAAHIDVQQLSGSEDSVVVNNTVDMRQLSGSSFSANVLGTVAANLSDSSGIGYSGSNPLPVTGTLVVSSITASSAAALVDSTGVQYSGSNPVPVTGTLVVSSITASTAAALVDSTGVAYSGSNPLPVTATLSGSLTSAVVTGDIPAGTADTGSAPVKIGGIARTTNPTAEADGDRLAFSTDDLGRQVIRVHQVRDLIKTAYVSVTSGTETTLLAGVAGAFLDMIMIVGSNNSDAAVSVDIRPVTGGNIVNTLRIPANGTAGWTPAVPWPQTDTGNNWTVDGPDETGRTLTFSALFSQEV